MRPLVYHDTAAGIAFFGALAAWAVFEVVLQARTRTEARDPSWAWMWVGALAGLALAFVASGAGARLPGPRWLPLAVGLALLVGGAVFRYWSVRTLGRFFKVTVGVADDQRVVDEGPYGVVRHPSYTGMLVVYLGIGAALDSWISVAGAFVPLLLAILNRIRHEERVLRRDLGQPYEAYARRTRALVPGLW